MKRIWLVILVVATLVFWASLALAQSVPAEAPDDLVMDPYAQPPAPQMDDREVPGARTPPPETCCDPLPPVVQPRLSYVPVPLQGTVPVTNKWRVVLGPDGQLYRERKTSRLGALIVGLGVLTTSYAVTAAYGRTSDATLIPVVGPFIGAGQTDSPIYATMLTIGGLAQAAGAALVIIGATGIKPRTERRKVALEALSGRF